MNRQSTGGIRSLLRENRLRAQNSGMHGHESNEHGAASVEFALSVTALLTFIFGILAMCMALYSYHFVSEAAREGSRYAMVRGSACSTYGKFSDCNIGTSTPIQTYVRSLSFPGINTNKITVTAAWPTTGAACTPQVTPCNNPGNLVRVSVSYQFPLSIPFIPARTLTMTSQSQMVIAD